jgi:hypothetical protein
VNDSTSPPRQTRPRGRPAEQTVYRGIHWHRDEHGQISFFDPDGERWVAWKRGIDAPPRPPGWGGGLVRPRWTTGWRLVPVVLTVAVVVIAVFQALRPSGNQVEKEAKASAALLGKCLGQSGSALGHPKYSSSPVPCSSQKAAVKVVAVLPSTPGSPLCPAGTVGVELPYAGVKFLHIECVEPVSARR